MFKLAFFCLVATAMAAGYRSPNANPKTGSESAVAQTAGTFNAESNANTDHTCANAVNCFNHETGQNFADCKTDLEVGEVASRGGADWCTIVKCAVVNNVATIQPAYPNDAKQVSTGECHGTAHDWLDCKKDDGTEMTNQECASTWTEGNCNGLVTCEWHNGKASGNDEGFLPMTPHGAASTYGADLNNAYTANPLNLGTRDAQTQRNRMITRISPKGKNLKHQCLIVPGQDVNVKGINCKCFCKA